MTAGFAPPPGGADLPAGGRRGRLRAPGPLRDLTREGLDSFRQAWRSQPPWTPVIVWILLTISGLTAWLLLFVFVLSPLQQQRDNSVLYSQFRQQLAEATAPVGGVIDPGAPVALVQAPVDGLRNVVVVEGTAPGDLMTGPGHRRDSVLPGQAGVSLIYGRSLTYGAPLANIDDLRTGTHIRVTTGQGVFTYVVDRVRRAGDPVAPRLAAGKGRMILETSTGPGWAPNNTIFVDTSLVGDAVAAPQGRLPAVPDSEKPMQNDTAHLVNLVLWLELVVALALGTVWAWARWGRPQAWVIGVPLLFAALWATTDNVMLLLPNLI